MGEGEDLESLSDEKAFDLNIIADLINKEILLVKIDRESRTLTIQFKPELLIDERQRTKAQLEVNKYMKAIAMEFNDFKNEYIKEHKEHDLSDDFSIKITRACLQFVLTTYVPGDLNQPQIS
jgi:hypothetical protein